MNPSDRLSGTTLHPGNLSQSSSARSPRDGTPAGHRDRMTHATDYERVPVEENAQGYIEVMHRVNRKGTTVCVHNEGAKTTR